MTFPEEDFPAVGKAAHEVMREGVEAGIWLKGGGGFMGYSPRGVGLLAGAHRRSGKLWMILKVTGSF